MSGGTTEGSSLEYFRICLSGKYRHDLQKYKIFNKSLQERLIFYKNRVVFCNLKVKVDF